jgi:Lar family restriction alleviation protein
MSEPELKPCPFCGSAPAFQLIPAHSHYLTDLPAAPVTWVLECSGCPAGFVEHTQQAVADLWNRRAPACSEVTVRRLA